MKYIMLVILLGGTFVVASAQISPALFGTWESIPVSQEKGEIPRNRFSYPFNETDTVILRSYFPKSKYHLKIIYAKTDIGPNQILMKEVKVYRVAKKAVDVSKELGAVSPIKLTISKVVGETMSIAEDYFDGKPQREYGLRPARE